MRLNVRSKKKMQMKSSPEQTEQNPHAGESKCSSNPKYPSSSLPLFTPAPEPICQSDTSSCP